MLLSTLNESFRSPAMKDGWYLARTRGSHRQFKHPAKSGLVTVSGKPSDDLAPGTLNSILKQAQFAKDTQEETE